MVTIPSCQLVQISRAIQSDATSLSENAGTVQAVRDPPVVRKKRDDLKGERGHATS